MRFSLGFGSGLRLVSGLEVTIESVLESLRRPCESFELSIVRIGHWKRLIYEERTKCKSLLFVGGRPLPTATCTTATTRAATSARRRSLSVSLSVSAREVPTQADALPERRTLVENGSTLSPLSLSLSLARPRQSRPRCENVATLGLALGRGSRVRGRLPATDGRRSRRGRARRGRTHAAPASAARDARNNTHCAEDTSFKRLKISLSRTLSLLARLSNKISKERFRSRSLFRDLISSKSRPGLSLSLSLSLSKDLFFTREATPSPATTRTSCARSSMPAPTRPSQTTTATRRSLSPPRVYDRSCSSRPRSSPRRPPDRGLA